ncbi:hypothetical protein [uncultured Amnibacterium sp.]|uniref:hypothetical protein n=1 Tax=uncultured Amnibacterium sp. TaxID=1631851 RepID=UPI0035CA8085
MGLTAALALLRAHVLVVAVPGRPVLRLRAEAAVRARGWLLVADPEDADLLLVCGRAGGAFAQEVEVLWNRVPAPRSKRTVADADGLDGALDSAARVLADGALQRRTAAEVPSVPAMRVPTRGRVRFGPAARDWPSGLVLDCALDRRGRVGLVDASGRPLEPVADHLRDRVDDELRREVLDLAGAAALLRLVGWTPPAARIDGVVDGLLADRLRRPLRRRVERIARRVEASVTLRWTLQRLVPGVPVRARLLELLGAPVDAAAGAAAPEWGALLDGRPPAAVPLIVAAAEAEHGRA